MNAFLRIAASAGLAAFMLASAATHAQADPRRSRLVIDCEQLKLPTQREVGELLGQHNLGQVYASRAALMAQAHRVCLRDPARVRQVAFETSPAPTVPPFQEQRIADDRRGR